MCWEQPIVRHLKDDTNKSIQLVETSTLDMRRLTFVFYVRPHIQSVQSDIGWQVRQI